VEGTKRSSDRKKSMHAARPPRTPARVVALVSTACLYTDPLNRRGAAAFQVVRLAAIEERDQCTGIQQQFTRHAST
jgi:hypothetical protein